MTLKQKFYFGIRNKANAKIFNKSTPFMNLFFFLAGLVFELRASHLQNRCATYSLSHTCSPFCSGYIGDGDLINNLPGLASNHDSSNPSL
jgi:hypothetical protein